MPTKTKFSITVNIQAPPASVWSVMRDVEQWPEWTSTVTSVRLLDGPIARGRRALIRQPKLLPTKWLVTDLDDARRRFTWVTKSPGVQVTARHTVESIPSGSRALLSIEFTGWLGPLVARLTRRLNEEYLEIEAKGLKKRSEGSA